MQGTPILAEHPPVVIATYLTLLLLLQLGYWYGFGSLFHLYLVAGNTVVGLGTVVWKYRKTLLDPTHWPKGLLNVLIGLVLLLLAIGISLAKAGLFRALTRRAGKRTPRSDGEV